MSESLSTPNPGPPQPEAGASPKPPRPKRKGKNYGQIHSRPLPLETHPLPAFHPSNPISLLRLAYTWLTQLLTHPTSHPVDAYVGYFSPETRSVHVSDPQHARALWEMGFFGKGTLSRSEPSWLEREKAKLSNGGGGRAAEDATNARREERRKFKLERARAEREKVIRQRLVEEGKLDVDEEKGEEKVAEEAAMNGSVEGKTGGDGEVPNGDLIPTHDSSTKAQPEPTLEKPEDVEIEDQEHLQLTLEEAFFLTYGLGILKIYPFKPAEAFFAYSVPEPYTTIELFEFFSQHCFFPPSETPAVDPDDQFLLNYVAYHHFRSLGWVVRPGVKFAVDYLLYNRGPVFSHAEFAVLILPSYSDRYWNTPGGRSRRRIWEQKDWWWLHAVNRVQSQVKKSLVLCYVDVPSPFDVDFDEPFDIGGILRRYRVREFVVRRWVANRSRD